MKNGRQDRIAETLTQIVDCRGRVCLPEPTVTTLEVMHKTSCSRASESDYYRQNDSIVNV